MHRKCKDGFHLMLVLYYDFMYYIFRDGSKSFELGIIFHSFVDSGVTRKTYVDRLSLSDVPNIF